MQINPIYLGLAIFCSILGAVGQIFLKLGSFKFSWNLLTWITNWKLVVGFSLYLLAAVLFVFVLSRVKLSVAYPIIALSYVWVTIFSIFILGESFTAYKWVGVALIVIGIAVIMR